MKNGDKAKILKSHHSSIQAGEIGVIECRKNGGYGVAFTKIFPAPISNFKPKEEKRVIYFDADQLQQI